jgi:hypothetical protein
VLMSSIKSRAINGQETLLQFMSKRAEKNLLDAPAADEFGKSIQRSMQENAEILKLIFEAKCAHFGRTFAMGEQVDSDDEHMLSL